MFPVVLCKCYLPRCTPISIALSLNIKNVACSDEWPFLVVIAVPHSPVTILVVTIGQGVSSAAQGDFDGW